MNSRNGPGLPPPDARGGVVLRAREADAGLPHARDVQALNVRARALHVPGKYLQHKYYRKTNHHSIMN